MRKNKLITLLSSLTLAVAGIAAIAAGASGSKKAESVSAKTGDSSIYRVYFETPYYDSYDAAWRKDPQIHYWGGSSGSTFPGPTMTWVKDFDGKKLFCYDIPSGTTGVKFSDTQDNGSRDQTVDITENIKPGVVWYLNGGYWGSRNVGTYSEHYDINITLDKGTHGSANGSTKIGYGDTIANGLTSISHVSATGGYNLSGYYTSASGGTKVINADGSICANVTDYTNATYWLETEPSITLYAQWEIDKNDGFYVYVNNNVFYPMSGISGGVSAAVDFSLNDQFKVVYIENKRIKEYYGYDVADKSETKACNSTVGQIGEDTSNHDLKVLSSADTYTVKLIYATGSTSNTIDIPRRHQVTFNANGGSEVPNPTYRVDYGSLIESQSSTKTGYSLSNWTTVDGVWDFSTWQVVKDSVLTANWTLVPYSISFDNNGGQGGSVSPTTYGISNEAQTITITAPTQTGSTPSYSVTVGGDYVGTGPSVNGNIVTIPAGAYGSFSINTVWTVDTYTVSYNHGTGASGEIASQTKTYGLDLTLSSSTFTNDGYHQVGWATSDGGAKVYDLGGTYSANAGATLYPVWEINKYTITWKNYDGTVLETDTNVSHGTTPTYDGATPTKAGDAHYSYTFKGWSPEVVPASENAEYIAQFNEIVNKYTITFENEDHTVLQSSDWEYGKTPVYSGSTPTKAATVQYTYTFDGWDKTIVSVTGDAIYTATYSFTVNEYTITFQNDDGTVLQSGKVAYGQTPVYSGSTPTKAATAQYTYTFDDWDKTIVSVTGETTYTATYSSTVNEYTITFKNDDGTVLQTGSVAYGQTPVYSGSTPTKVATEDYTYTFKEWNVSPVSVTGDATYNATKTPLKEAKDYAAKFLEEMDGVCILEKDSEGNIQVNTVVEDLAGAWSSMATDYAKLSKDAQDLLTGATPVYEESSEDVVGKFAASYDYIYGKYHSSLDEIDGVKVGDFAKREPNQFANSRLFSVSEVSTSTWIIAAVAVVGIAAVGVFFIYRKRKEN